MVIKYVEQLGAKERLQTLVNESSIFMQSK